MQEQRVLIVLSIVIGLGLAFQHFQSVNAGDAIELIQQSGEVNQGDKPGSLSLKLPDSRLPAGQRASRRLNINTASEQELANGGLYLIGPKNAQAIVDYRNTHGVFRSLAEIELVPGIGPKTLAGMRDRITLGDVSPTSPTLSPVEAIMPGSSNTALNSAGESDKAGNGLAPPPRININAAGAEELTRIKHVGPVTAQEIIAYRRIHGPFRRPEDLMKVKGIKQLKFAELRHMIKVEND